MNSVLETADAALASGESDPEHVSDSAVGKEPEDASEPGSRLYAVRRMQISENGWCWCVYIGRRGQPFTRRFYDGVHGGTEKALEAAIAWRNEVMDSVPALTLTEFCSRVRSNNKSGVPGVRKTFPKRQPLGAWVADIKLSDGTKGYRSFSIKRYGHDKAFELAVQARQAMLDAAKNRLYLYNEDALRRAAAHHHVDREHRSVGSSLELTSAGMTGCHGHSPIEGS